MFLVKMDVFKLANILASDILLEKALEAFALNGEDKLSNILTIFRFSQQLEVIYFKHTLIES
jgi:hypothetical protein